MLIEINQNTFFANIIVVNDRQSSVIKFHRVFDQYLIDY